MTTFTEFRGWHYCRCHPTSWDVEKILTLDDDVEVYSCVCGVLDTIGEKEMDEGPVMEELMDTEERIITNLTGEAERVYLASDKGQFEQGGCQACGEQVVLKDVKMHEGLLFHKDCWADEMTAKDQMDLYDDQQELIRGNY